MVPAGGKFPATIGKLTTDGLSVKLEGTDYGIIFDLLRIITVSCIANDLPSIDGHPEVDFKSDSGNYVVSFSKKLTGTGTLKIHFINSKSICRISLNDETIIGDTDIHYISVVPSNTIVTMIDEESLLKYSDFGIHKTLCLFGYGIPRVTVFSDSPEQAGAFQKFFLNSPEDSSIDIDNSGNYRISFPGYRLSNLFQLILDAGPGDVLIKFPHLKSSSESTILTNTLSHAARSIFRDRGITVRLSDSDNRLVYDIHSVIDARESDISPYRYEFDSIRSSIWSFRSVAEGRRIVSAQYISQYLAVRDRKPGSIGNIPGPPDGVIITDRPTFIPSEIRERSRRVYTSSWIGLLLDRELLWELITWFDEKMPDIKAPSRQWLTEQLETTVRLVLCNNKLRLLEFGLGYLKISVPVGKEELIINKDCHEFRYVYEVFFKH